MKIMIKLSVILGLMFLITGTTQKVMAQNEDVSLQSFYDELSPYGTWIQDPQYGYVWRPDVDQDEFRPYYSNGRWVMTEYGNTWVSNYDWGWAPFHYGRWVYNRYNQWLWIPDTVWGPAWVSWRSGGGYYGWAPLGPSISIGINIGHGGYRVPDFCWNFIPYNNIYYNSYPRYYASRNRVYIQNTVIINNTYIRNNRTYYTGPRAEEVRRATNQNVTVYNINRSNRPGVSRVENNTVNIYNPRPSRGDNSNAAPRNVVQGNVNRGVVGRDNNGVVSNRPGRGENGNVFGDRNNGSSNRPSRGENGNVVTDNRGNGNVSSRPGRGGNNEVNSVQGRDGRVGVAPNGDNNAVGQRPSIFGRNREGGENQPQRVDRSEMPQRMERSREMPQQPQAQPMPQQRMERPQPMQQAPQQQRMERPQPQMQAPQRSERVQQAPPQRSSGGEARGGGGGSRGGESRGGGRPGRG